jgi:hypothetical protein
VIDFGTTNGGGEATSEVPVLVHSCYSEQVTAVKDVTATLPHSGSEQLLANAKKSGAAGDNPSLSSTLPADAITVRLTNSEYDIAPSVKGAGERQAGQGVIGLSLKAHQNCPAGHFVGAVQLQSSAKTPEYLAYTVSVPGRLVANPELIKVVVKKPGFFFAQPCETALEGELKQSGTAKATYDVTLKPGSGEIRQVGGKGQPAILARLDSALVNEGKLVNLTIDTDKSGKQTFKLPVSIPADQRPGKYSGKLNLEVRSSADNVAPSDIPYEIVIQPSAWEEVAPVAVPIFVILILSTAFGIFLWITNQKRSG